MRRLLPALLLAALAVQPMAARAAGDEEEPSRRERTRLFLQATPRHGFNPLEITLYARLEGVPEGETRFCHAGVEWIGETRSGRVMRSTEDARCIHPKDVKRVDHSFSKDVYISRPSVYRYYVVLHMKDGSIIKSNAVDVRVISSR